MTATRWAWAEIDLTAIESNVKALKALTAPRTLFMAVVKADGYGHGAIQVARAALDAGADRLGVATVDEALQLRGAGIDQPIHVLSEPPTSAADLLLDHDIIPTVTTREFALAFGKAASERAMVARYHLKVDTGMNRIGVCAKDAPRFAAGLRGVPGLVMEGTFTHFATADVPGDWDFDRQLQAFVESVDALRTEGVDPGIVHAANSPATILHPESHFDMVRCGLAVYGLHPSEATYSAIALSPAMSVKARAVLVKSIGMGDGVSYGLTYRASSPTSVATLPLGYADGVHRVLSSQMDVLVNGQRARQIGRICMDQLMVEVPRGGAARVGDEFVVVGVQGRERIGMDELAERAGTINYEVACAFGLRMPRVYR